MKEFDIHSYLQEKSGMLDLALHEFLSMEDGPSTPLFKAMRYSLMAGGKRVRPILMLAGVEAVGGDPTDFIPFACAIECIHTYSLIHDDLPAMDDDDLRRGRPTCHKVFGEAMAILAGDGLLTRAFELMTDHSLVSNISPESVIKAISIISKAAGASGMVGGQAADIIFEGKDVDLDTLFFIHSHKTGALIQASVEAGGLLGGGNAVEVECLRAYGAALGLAFQIIDDILDVEGDKAVMGKPVGSDAKKKKATYPAFIGIDESKKKANILIDEAISALLSFDERADPLRAIARYVVERNR
ncbi:MAG: polyprenyl synthetase family protein [Dissulfurimicrobium sp.]|uniref:polyprenyl synthetase family protein n=1 Tax=Dissulfurimicrobium sp. TaxID=2022436 RepID=UPI00404A1689